MGSVDARKGVSDLVLGFRGRGASRGKGVSDLVFAASRDRLPVSGFRDVPCGNIGPWPHHCGSRPKDGQALRVSFVAQDVFHGFIAVAL